MHLIAVARVQSPTFEVQPYPPALGIMRIEVYNGQNDILAVFAFLAVGDELLVIRGMKIEGIVGLERGIFAADPVYFANQLAEISEGIPRPGPDFILLRIEILFAFWFSRLVFRE